VELQQIYFKAPTNAMDWNKAATKQQLLSQLLEDKIMRATMDKAAKALKVKLSRGLTDDAVKEKLIEYLASEDAEVLD
jgi:hypothetical protein